MDTVYIPTNYTDAGKLLGAFALRHVAECAAICLPLAAMVVPAVPPGADRKNHCLRRAGRACRRVCPARRPGQQLTHLCPPLQPLAEKQADIDLQGDTMDTRKPKKNKKGSI